MTKPVVFEFRALNLPNLITVTRIVLVYPLYLYSNSYLDSPGNEQFLTELLILTGIVLITDFLDGFLARLLKQTTNLGRYLDPISDKIVLISILSLLVFYYDYPELILFLFVLREIASTAGGIFLYYRRNMVAKPNIWGKMGIFFGGISIFWYIPQPFLHLRYPDYSGLLTEPIWSVYAFALTIVMSVYYYTKSYGAIVFLKKP
jgi:CDP-diacylglycerol--glycerol-3-phosphate 3-phosphatidyltransferase